MTAPPVPASGTQPKQTRRPDDGPARAIGGGRIGVDRLVQVRKDTGGQVERPPGVGQVVEPVDPFGRAGDREFQRLPLRLQRRMHNGWQSRTRGDNDD